MSKRKQITPKYSFDKPTFVKFLDRTDFKLAKYNDISLEGFSCFCNKPMKIAEKACVEINLKMISGGLIDDLEMHVATAEVIGRDEIDGKTVLIFKFVDFEADCFDNLVKAIDYLDHKEKLISLPNFSTHDDVARSTLSDLVKNLSKSIKSGQISLPVLPKVIQEVEDVIKNPNATSDDIAKVIEQDAVISVKLISLANSSYYRGTTHIVTVKETIPRLGMKEVQNMVLTIANKSLYKAKNKHFNKLLEKLWLHSLACAYNAKAIAYRLGMQNTDLFFTIGLVHDIGMTMLLRVLGDMLEDKKSFDTNELIESISNYKSEIAGLILKYWKFSDHFVDIATTYKDRQLNQNTDKGSLIINIADHLAYHIGYGIRDENIDMVNIEAVNRLSISSDILDEIGDETKEAMTASAGVL